MELSEQEAVLRRTKFSQLSDDEFLYLLVYCQKRGLSPWLGHVIAQRRYQGHRGELVILVSIHALRGLAEGTKEFAGRVGPLWCGSDRVWQSEWTHPFPPVAAKVGIKRKGDTEPTWDVAHWREFAQWRLDERGEPVLDEFWEKMGSLMLAKCAEAMALRARFPDACGAIYIPEEMMTPIPTKKVPTPSTGEDSAPTSEFLFQLRLVRDFEMVNAVERNAAVQRMREKYPYLSGVDFYAAALKALAEERQTAAG